MTISLSVANIGALGAQRPRLASFPDYVSTSGYEVVELAAMAGLDLDEWQQYVLINALGERIDGSWAAFEIGLCVPRQNGKGGVLEAMELGGLFLLDERLIVHSAHQFDTSLEAFRRLDFLIEGRDEFTRRVKRVSRSHGEEGIELYGPKGRRRTGAQRIRFRTRTKGGGRGFTGDRVILDEAMILPVASHSAILPIVSARPNPQVVYTGSAVDQQIHDDGLVFARVRARGIEGSGRLAWFEWSAEGDNPDDLSPEDLADMAAWAIANPAKGIRITDEHIANELASLTARSFAVERLGVGSWPNPITGGLVIDLDAWNGLADTDSSMRDPVALAFDVSPDRSTAGISAAGRRDDGLAHIEVIDHRRGTGWVVDRLVALDEKWHPAAIICDAAGPAGSLIGELEERGLQITPVTAREHAQACGKLYDAVDQKTVRHLGQPELADALRGATKRTLGDAWLWSRRNSDTDISPLVAVTLAHWSLYTSASGEPWAAGW